MVVVKIVWTDKMLFAPYDADLLLRAQQQGLNSPLGFPFESLVRGEISLLTYPYLLN